VRTELDGIGLDSRVGHLRHQLLVSRFRSGQLVQHVQLVGIPLSFSICLQQDAATFRRTLLPSA
jgi:hypothetical protein